MDGGGDRAGRRGPGLGRGVCVVSVCVCVCMCVCVCVWVWVGGRRRFTCGWVRGVSDLHVGMWVGEGWGDDLHVGGWLMNLFMN